MSDDDLKVLKIWLSEMLSSLVMTLTFITKDGNEKILKCTTSPKLVNPQIEILNYENADFKPVFDIDSNSWTSIEWDTIKRIEFSII